MSDIVSEKTCTRCHQVFPATTEFFYKSTKNKSGLLGHCKKCQLEMDRKWRADNAERWLVKNREHVREWRKNNPGKVREQHRRKLKRDRETRNPNYLARIKRSQERRRQKQDPLTGVVNANNARAKMRKARGRIKVKDLNMLYDTQKGLCWWCGKPLNHNWRLDHRVALAKGGSNELNNLCCACPECNASKSDKWPWQFNGRLI